ncbi:hypothetical protein WJX79_009266 [Trebouxia sp. C0005]
MSRRRALSLWSLVTLTSTTAQQISFRATSSQRQLGGIAQHQQVHPDLSSHECTGSGQFGLLCLFHNLVLWQKQFYYITSEEISIPEVREGWHLSWHPRGEAMLPEHVTVVSPSALPWEHEQGVQTEYLDQALIYNWLDQGNMFHQMMEAGNFIYATACRLLDACTHDTSHYQLFATGYFEFANDNGLPAAHESLQCLTSRIPRWIEDSYWDDQVVVIGKTAVGLGGHCNESEHEDKLQCEWDSISYMQNEYTSGHRQLLLDCLGVTDQSSKPSQQQTKVTIVQRLLAKGRSMLNVLEMKSAIAATGAEVQIVNMEGKTLKQQAEVLAHSHIYILVHGAAMALYMFLPKHAAIIEIQHHYAHSAVYPSDMHQRTVTRYDMDYHHELLISQKSTDIFLQKDKVLKDEVYQKLTAGEQLQLWEQGLCPGEKDDKLQQHCVQHWIFLAGNMVVDLEMLKDAYHRAWQSLPA